MGANDRPLISVLVLCYNNQKYIFQTLTSIFMQNYPNLEVLIGDDKSEDFDFDALNNWIQHHRPENIKNIFIKQNEKNLGTVANLEKLINESKGEFLFLIAADDVLFDDIVLENFYNRAVQLGVEAEFFTAQTEMWDVELKNKIGDFISETDIEKIQNYSITQLFGECAYRPFIPASNFYRRTVFNKVGSLSGQYRLVEDWPMQLRCLRKGIKIHYLPIVSIKHRDGGISHGNLLHPTKTYLLFYCDLLNAYLNEVLPFESLLSKEDRRRARRYYEDRLRAYFTIHLPSYQSGSGGRLEDPMLDLSILGREWKHIKRAKCIAVIKNHIKRYCCLNSIFRTFLLSTLFFIAGSIIATLEYAWSSWLAIFYLSCGFIGLGLFLAQVGMKALIFLKKNYRK